MASTIVRKIKIKHSGNFIIDTVAPEGIVLINGGDNYTKSDQVTISLDASDATTGIKDIETRNIDITKTDDGETEQSYNFIPLEYRENFIWSLPVEEGFKKVEVKFRDYANNVSEFISTINARKFFNLDEKIIDKIVKLGLDYYSSIDGSDGSIYKTRHFPSILETFSNETIADIINNNNVLYVGSNGALASTVYGLVDGEFVVINEFSSDIINMASYDGDLYVSLDDNRLYRKDSSAWFLVETFTRDVAYIGSDGRYLYIFFDDSNETMQIYNGVSFSTISILSGDTEEESEESSSLSDSSDSSSSTLIDSSSSITESLSSRSSLESSSSQSNSTSSTSTNARTSSTSSGSSSDSSTLEESSKSSPSSESITSDSYLGQFSDSSDTSLDETSSESSSEYSVSSDSSKSSSSSSSGVPCDCGKYTSSSIYAGGFTLNNMRDRFTSGCNLFGRLVNIGDGLARVLLYMDIEKNNSTEVARSNDFFSGVVPKEDISISGVNGSGITGTFNYIAKFSSTSPHDFVILCEGTNTSSQSSSTDSSSYSERSSSQSLDPLIGDGTSADPFIITSASHLLLVNANPEAYYIMASNIDMSSIGNFVPIGSVAAPFSGNFNGNGYRISFLNIEREDEDNVGLFGYTEGADIYDIESISCNVLGNENVGAIIGHMNGGSLNRSSCGSSVSGTKNTGGLVGKMSNGSEIINCFSRANSNSASRCGGFVGERGDSATIMNSYSTGFVSGGFAGGFVSRINDESGDNGEVVSCYWDVQTSGTASSVDGTGKNTSQMKIQSTFSGWNFTSIWAINSLKNNGYPYLRISRSY